MAGYTVLEIGRIKANQIDQVQAHNLRQKETRNADRSIENHYLVGDATTNFREQIYDRIHELNLEHKIRHDANVALEVITSFSRNEKEYIDSDQWEQENLKWIEQTFGKENIVSCVVHRDETANMHIHTVFVPVDDKGKLNSQHYIRGKAKLSHLQDTYANAMRIFGLERGLKKTPARHQDIQRWYRSMEKAEAEIPKPKEHETAKEYLDRAKKEIGSFRAAAKREAEEQARAAIQKEFRQARAEIKEEKEVSLADLLEEKKGLERTLSDLRHQVQETKEQKETLKQEIQRKEQELEAVPEWAGALDLLKKNYRDRKHYQKEMQKQALYKTYLERYRPDHKQKIDQAVEEHHKSKGQER